MDYQALFNELHLFEQLLALLVGMPRLFMLVQVAPFMGGNILTGQLRTTVVFACYLVLHPAIVASLPETQGLSPSTFALYGAILVKETLIGMLLGYLSGMLFWTIQCAGFFIDNQRGASMAEGADPLSGEQTSPLGLFPERRLPVFFHRRIPRPAWRGLRLLRNLAGHAAHPAQRV